MARICCSITEVAEMNFFAGVEGLQAASNNILESKRSDRMLKNTVSRDGSMLKSHTQFHTHIEQVFPHGVGFFVAGEDLIADLWSECPPCFSLLKSDEGFDLAVEIPFADEGGDFQVIFISFLYPPGMAIHISKVGKRPKYQ